MLGEDIYYVLVSMAIPDAPDLRAFHILEDGAVVEMPLTVRTTATPE